MQSILRRSRTKPSMMCAFNVKTAFCFLLAICLLITHASATEIKGSCLPGNNHKPSPSREGADYQACRIFKESSCCTADFTKQLAVPVIQKIGSFSWTLCGNLSKKCQDFMVGVECFYRCSPYVALWQDKKEKQAFNDAPVCSHYCDDWFDACQDDMTCAKNWIKDFNISKSDWSNSCKVGATCKTFKDVYKNGKGLCESMWDDSFKYTSQAPCLHFNFSGPTNPNKDAVEKIFARSGPPVQCSFVLVLVSLWLAVASLFLA